MTTKAKIEEILWQKFAIDHLEIVDDSPRHAGHAEQQKSGGRHFALLIVSKDFTNKELLERHRMIYQTLKHDLKSTIHALAIKALTPEEYKAHTPN